LFNLEIDGYRYSRISNPTTAVLERRVAALERGLEALSTSTGRKPLHYAVLDLATPGNDIGAYFAGQTRAACPAYRELLGPPSGFGLVASFPAVAKEKLSYDWRRLAAQLHRNWLAYLLERRTRNSTAVVSLQST
jgi:cystathionine beta-lyase/cystathionine gamma-synthase